MILFCFGKSCSRSPLFSELRYFHLRVDSLDRRVNNASPHVLCITTIRKGIGQFSLRPEQTKGKDYVLWKPILILGLIGLQACSAPAKSVEVSASKPKLKVIGTGQASYYGGRHNGRRTASGTIFRSASFTAAHRKLPFGTHVIVTNLVNKVSCPVEITDRGPAEWTQRIIDVSEGTAQCLGMIQSGVTSVSLSVSN
jgi:rare lipoprotein A